MAHHIKKITIETAEMVLEVIPAKNDELALNFNTEIINLHQRDSDTFRRIEAGSKEMTLEGKFDSSHVTVRLK